MPTGVSNGSSIVGRLRPFWYYDWEAGPLTGAASEFVPMIRDNEAGNVERNFYELSRGKPGFVLAYDEPDLSSIPPEDKFWTKSYAPRLSPSIVPASPASSNDDWYKSFLKSPTAADFKIMAVHLFVDVKDISAKDVDTEVAEFKERLESVVKESQRPVWVTEFGLKTPNATPGSPAKFSDKKAACFMAQVIPLLEKKAMRYAWFSPVPDARNPQDATLPDALWNRDGSLTTLGTLYRQ
jgi:hypothetical protein